MVIFVYTASDHWGSTLTVHLLYNNDLKLCEPPLFHLLFEIYSIKIYKFKKKQQHFLTLKLCPKLKI